MVQGGQGVGVARALALHLRAQGRRGGGDRALQDGVMDDGRIAPSRGARIVDGATGLAVAEVKRKTTAAGVALGADVLTLAVEPGVDRSIIMGLVLVHGLINRAM